MLDSDLMYTCSLIEYIGREQKLRRGDVVAVLGCRGVSLIYSHASVLHSEVIASVAYEYIKEFNIPTGTYDNVAACHYVVPDYWTMGEVYARLIEDVSSGNIVAAILEVYGSWMADAISNYNSDLFYQSRDYLRECYLADEVLAA